MQFPLKIFLKFLRDPMTFEFKGEVMGCDIHFKRKNPGQIQKRITKKGMTVTRMV